MTKLLPSLNSQLVNGSGRDSLPRRKAQCERIEPLLPHAHSHLFSRHDDDRAGKSEPAIAADHPPARKGRVRCSNGELELVEVQLPTLSRIAPCKLGVLRRPSRVSFSSRPTLTPEFLELDDLELVRADGRSPCHGMRPERARALRQSLRRSTGKPARRPSPQRAAARSHSIDYPAACFIISSR